MRTVSCAVLGMLLVKLTPSKSMVVLKNILWHQLGALQGFSHGNDLNGLMAYLYAIYRKYR